MVENMRKRRIALENQHGIKIVVTVNKIISEIQGACKTQDLYLFEKLVATVIKNPDCRESKWRLVNYF